MSLNSFEVPFTRMPNIIIDKYLPDLQGSEYQVLTVIIRKTIGFNKERDKIALSTLEKMSGQARSTVVQAVKELLQKQLITKDSSTIPTTYSINQEVLTRDTPNPKEVVRISNHSTIIQPPVAVLSNQQLVRNSNTQKNTFKQKKETTTSSDLNENVLKVIEEWNLRFKQQVGLNDLKMIGHIKNALNQFSVRQLISAMERRSIDEYYILSMSHLKHFPKCFFPYLDTIENDLNRKPKGILTYDEMINKVTSSQGLTTENFSMVKDVLDDSGKPMWKLNS
tara:strand:- start:1791 stop:2630 length:840 start_codon:yes stop_codon:yes gene_type:complete